MKPPQLSVIIITKNQSRFLQPTLKMLQQQTYQDFETIIVDSGSTDGSLKLYSQFAHRLIQIQPQKFNYAQAFNQGAKIAQGKILLRLSGDAIPGNQDFLKSLVNDFRSPNIGGVCGRYVYSSKMALGYKIMFSYNQGFGQTACFKQPFPITGACFAFKKSLWQTHPFNEKVKIGEDIEWTFWVLSKKYSLIYEPQAWVYHEHRNTPLLQLPFLSLKILDLCFYLSKKYPQFLAGFLKLALIQAVKYPFGKN